MFADYINNLDCLNLDHPVFDRILVSGYGQGDYTNYPDGSRSDDETLRATTQALLYKRMLNEKEKTAVRIATSYSTIRVQRLNEFTAQSVETYIYPYAIDNEAFDINPRIPSGRSSYIQICSVSCRDSLGEKTVTDVINIIGTENSTLNRYYDYCPDLSVFLTQHGYPSKVFRPKTDSGKNDTVLFIGKYDIKAHHLVQSLIPRLLPQYFKGENNLTPKEIVLLTALERGDVNDYIRLISEIYSDFNIEEDAARRSLTEFTKGSREQQIQNYKNRVEDTHRSIEMCITNMASYQRNLDEFNDKLFALMNRQSDSSSDELIEFFVANKALHFVSSDVDTIQFRVTTTLNNFDPDIAEALIDNEESYLYDVVNSIADTESMSKFYKALFIDETIKLNMDATFIMSHYRIDTSSRGNMSPNFYPNPHISHYNCLGSNGVAMAKAVGEGDYLTALSLCVSSTGNLNLSDGVVGSRFAQEMFLSSSRFKENRIIILPDGRNVTVYDCIKYLNGKEE